jgi:hypothetical protein
MSEKAIAKAACLKSIPAVNCDLPTLSLPTTTIVRVTGWLSVDGDIRSG